MAGSTMRASSLEGVEGTISGSLPGIAASASALAPGRLLRRNRSDRLEQNPPGQTTQLEDPILVDSITNSRDRLGELGLTRSARKS